MKALVLFSGGIDSTTALGLAIQKYGKDQVIALSVSYGQKHDKEIKAAIAVAQYYGSQHQTWNRCYSETGSCSRKVPPGR